MYLRFIAAAEDQNPWLANGIITKTNLLHQEGLLEPYESEVALATFEWFNEHLPCPPFSEKRGAGEWTDDAVAWFLPTAKEPISRMWDLMAILREHVFPARVIRAPEPGKIVYRDEFQIVAETPRSVLL